MKQILVLIIITFCLVNCSSTKESIKVEVHESNQDIILFYSKKMNAIWAISLPFNVEIINTFSEDNAFLNYKYMYGSELKGKAMKMYLIEEERLLKQSISKIKYIEAKSSKEYLVRSKHFVDTTKYNRLFFKPYIEKILSLKQDTLHIGTVSKFKQKHKELFEKLTKNDSISIQFFDEDKFGEKITVPAKW
ncbi:hypothetical protein A8C32_03935 [Flavivirga aquatica]|uniref:Uncharacterized protein n=1 Tax=Flavivirga aquatica TaxID=1849968 RepID=A0A1E5TB69_9FLAO|nr:hypothetical protein [Flavivirga aquatica]OEK08609.1 hypothetical protein A8C32_03935 [Flavivirga aquatica]